MCSRRNKRVVDTRSASLAAPGTFVAKKGKRNHARPCDHSSDKRIANHHCPSRARVIPPPTGRTASE